MNCLQRFYWRCLEAYIVVFAIKFFLVFSKKSNPTPSWSSKVLEFNGLVQFNDKVEMHHFV